MKVAVVTRQLLDNDPVVSIIISLSSDFYITKSGWYSQAEEVFKLEEKAELHIAAFKRKFVEFHQATWKVEIQEVISSEELIVEI